MKKIILTATAFLMISSFVFAQGSRMGTASSTQLQVVQGARYLSGGGAAANAVGMDAVYWNPAGLSLSDNGVDAIFSNRQYIADIENNFFGVSVDFLNMKMGANVRTFNIGDINETTVFSPDGTGQVFTPNFSIIGATASKKLSDNTSVGLNANYVRESFGRVSASGMAFDLGVQYKGLASMEGLDVGFVLRNFGQPVKYDGEGLGVLAEATAGDRPVEYYKVDAASFDLPFAFDMGVTYSLSGIGLGFTYTSNYYATDEMKFKASYDLGEIASLGAGFQMSSVAKDQSEQGDGIQAIAPVDSEWYSNPFDGVSFGASLNLSQFTGMNMTLDYAMLPAGDFAANNVIALRVGF
ncbi:MAG: hypothetical protein CMQ51_03360 [Gammaproteobacteria bacterium]|nr:hypothetical protein [Gammaproteobacteria bacterium]